ncbi:MAG TPA: rRNA maturation RNase YbeY [Bacteroidetes bacterium]|nr:rRNA maturation RNase YbeY [Candidatus Limimorpha avicola]
MISFQGVDVDVPVMNREVLKKWINGFVGSYGKVVGELYYLFCSDEYLYKMNVEVLRHDFYTDVITFQSNDNDTVLSGEIYISIDRVKENALALGLRYEDELNRVMAHGVLHLMGFKDKTDEDAIMMRQQEDFCLKMRNLYGF